MRLVSTRTPSVTASFREAVFQGIAPDGGLFHPVDDYSILGPVLSGAGDSFRDVAFSVARTILGDEFSEGDLEDLVERAFPFAPQLRELAPGITVLELFHGPSCAFKDFGASFLARVMERLASEWRRPPVILTATSGDTGSAVAQAFHNVDAIEVVILYPSGRVSPLQEKQLTTLGGNVRALEVSGSFDDCQALVKEAFLDAELGRAVSLTSANSINIGRLLPQSFYYAWAWRQLGATEDIWFCVPSGNFGNLTAGVFCKRWGLPIGGYIAATNRNDVVPEYLESGIFAPRASIHTISNAMDVGNPSNFERLSRIYDDQVDAMKQDVRGYAVSDAETRATMQRHFQGSGTFLCPHTAAGVFAGEQMRRQGLGGEVTISLGTADAAKFGEVVVEATGEAPRIPERLSRLLDREKESLVIPPVFPQLREFLLDTYST